MKKTTVLSQKEVYRSRYFRVNQVEIQRNGKTFTKDIIERNSSVIILPLTESGEIYMVTQYRDAFQKVLLELIAGTIDSDASPLESAKRELAEEGGFVAKKWKHVATFLMSANLIGELHIFVATDLEPVKRHLDEDEEMEVVKLSLEDALKKIETGEIRISSNVASLLLVDKLKKEGKL